jgi:hypothetical protein
MALFMINYIENSGSKTILDIRDIKKKSSHPTEVKKKEMSV